MYGSKKFFKIFRYILQQKDVVKCSLDYIKIYFAKMLDFLPYVLNPLILLKLMKIMHNNMEIGNNNINSKLQ